MTNNENNNNNKKSPQELEKIIEEALESGKEPAQIDPEHIDKFTWHNGDLMPFQKKAKKTKES